MGNPSEFLDESNSENTRGMGYMRRQLYRRTERRDRIRNGSWSDGGGRIFWKATGS